MAARSLLLVVCLLLAGCGSVADGGTGGTGGDGAETATVTPAPLPTETPPSRTQTPPPGSSVPVSSLSELPADHAAALSNWSFTATTRQVVIEDGRVLYDVTSHLRVDGTQYRYERTRIVDPSYPGPQGIDTLSLYHHGNRTAFRDEDDGGIRYGVVEGSFRFGPGDDFAGERALADLLPAFGTWTAAPVGDATVLRGSTLVDPEPLDVDRRLGTADEATLRLRVEPTGQVSWVKLEYDATLNGQRVTVRVERQFTAVGSTAVPEPPWLARALGTETPPARGAPT